MYASEFSDVLRSLVIVATCIEIKNPSNMAQVGRLTFRGPSK